MPKPFMALAISATLFLSACSAPAAETAEKPPETESTEPQLAPVQEKIEDWGLLADAKIEPFNEDTGKFSGDQVEMVSKDVIKLAEKQLSADQATSKEDVKQQIDEFASSAPGALSKSMSKQVEKDARDKEKNFWTLIYLQPISDSYSIEDDSRFTYAWNAELEAFEDYMGVTVTLFTRTAYWLRTDDGEKTMISIGRWISLSTVDPTYSASTGDYGWYAHAHIDNADICSATEGKPLVPVVPADLDGLKRFVSLDSSTFAPKDYLGSDQDETDKELAKCGS